MYYTESVRDIFKGDDESDSWIYAQCVSSDFGMGKGIAVAFNEKFDCKANLLRRIPDTLVRNWHESNPCCRVVRDGRVFCLVTKRHYWEKPTPGTLRLSLLQLRKNVKEYILDNGYSEDQMLLVIPPLGCGLDRLCYADVKRMIHEIFNDMDIRIECRTNSPEFAERNFTNY